MPEKKHGTVAAWPEDNAHRTSRRTLSLSSDDSSTSHDLLRLIAEKERHCFELREQLASEEAQLKQLRSTWQRRATKELAYSAPPSAAQHRREGSTASSTSDVATDAWNSLSSRLPGSLKTQLNNLLDTIVNVDQPPAPVEKQRGLTTPSADGMLRPTGGGLGVLEEEGSEVGSVALSPRSPRSPALGTELAHSRSTSPNTTITPRTAHNHGKLSSLSARDSQALGFTVDANGIATPIVSQGPPTPPKSDAVRSASNSRASILGSLAGLGSRQSDTASGEGTGTFASMFAKRLKEARDNASDLLREAERKLGNAMTIDELTTPSEGPQIKLEEASYDSGWYAAAGGRKSKSPNLGPIKVPEDGGRRLSVSSSSSDGGKGRSSPVLGGIPGAAGMFGMLMAQKERRASGDDWGWGKGDSEDEDWVREGVDASGKKRNPPSDKVSLINLD